MCKLTRVQFTECGHFYGPVLCVCPSPPPPPATASSSNTDGEAAENPRRAAQQDCDVTRVTKPVDDRCEECAVGTAPAHYSEEAWEKGIEETGTKLVIEYDVDGNKFIYEDEADEDEEEEEEEDEDAYTIYYEKDDDGKVHLLNKDGKRY
ncbi:MAG: hypothetical protein M1817_001426 [Caeruleum heppii]|nr:MAG: hypothetical protein M1817_001426 [Caeruleum heppii]